MATYRFPNLFGPDEHLFIDSDELDILLLLLKKMLRDLPPAQHEPAAAVIADMLVCAIRTGQEQRFEAMLGQAMLSGEKPATETPETQETI